MLNENKIRYDICKHLYEYIGRKHMYRFIKGKVKLFVIHIDDTFFIWAGSENNPQQVISKINEVHLSIKFDFNCSKTQINFFGTTLKKITLRKAFNKAI